MEEGGEITGVVWCVRWVLTGSLWKVSAGENWDVEVAPERIGLDCVALTWHMCTQN